MDLKCAVIAVCFVLASTPAFAGCYTPQEYEAEQGIRIHSELMVIGLTCQKMPDMRDSYAKYKQFTLKNARLLGGYENELIGFYRKSGISSPDMELHGLRTRLANQISRHAISMSTKSFCNSFGPRINQALAMDEKTLRLWAQKAWNNHPASQRMCKRV